MSRELPAGITEEEVRRIIDHYDSQTDEQAIAEIEAALSASEYIKMLVPRAIAREVLRLIQKFEDQQDAAPTKKEKRRKSA